MPSSSLSSPYTLKSRALFTEFETPPSYKKEEVLHQDQELKRHQTTSSSSSSPRPVFTPAASPLIGDDYHRLVRSTHSSPRMPSFAAAATTTGVHPYPYDDAYLHKKDVGGTDPPPHRNHGSDGGGVDDGSAEDSMMDLPRCRRLLSQYRRATDQLRGQLDVSNQRNAWLSERLKEALLKGSHSHTATAAVATPSEDNAARVGSSSSGGGLAASANRRVQELEATICELRGRLDAFTSTQQQQQQEKANDSARNASHSWEGESTRDSEDSDSDDMCSSIAAQLRLCCLRSNYLVRVANAIQHVYTVPHAIGESAASGAPRSPGICSHEKPFCTYQLLRGAVRGSSEEGVLDEEATLTRGDLSAAGQVRFLSRLVLTELSYCEGVCCTLAGKLLGGAEAALREEQGRRDPQELDEEVEEAEEEGFDYGECDEEELDDDLHDRQHEVSHDTPPSKVTEIEKEDCAVQ